MRFKENTRDKIKKELTKILFESNNTDLLK